MLEARAVTARSLLVNWENRSIEVVVTEKNGGYLVMLDGRQVMVELGDFRTLFDMPIKDSKAPHRSELQCLEK